MQYVVEDLFGYPDQEHAAGDRCELWDAPLVNSVHFRQWKISPQFFSPNLRGLRRFSDLFVCDFCGCDFVSEKNYTVHAELCERRIIGRELYRDMAAGIVITEAVGVDEASGPSCQRFCLLAKHFLDHKETFLDVESFLFYLLFEVDEYGLHFAGYFSKDRQQQCLSNLACIAVLPPYQSKGYGSLLIQLSYELTRREGRRGSPERPITNVGRKAFTACWCRMVAVALCTTLDGVSISEISQATGMLPCDILSVLACLGALRSADGRHIIVINDEVERWAKSIPRLTLDLAELRA
jgi:histone acetyltransferase MYST1